MPFGHPTEAGTQLASTHEVPPNLGSTNSCITLLESESVRWRTTRKHAGFRFPERSHQVLSKLNCRDLGTRTGSGWEGSEEDSKAWTVTECERLAVGGGAHR